MRKWALGIGTALLLSALCACGAGGGEAQDEAALLQEEYRALESCSMTAQVRCERESETEDYTLRCDWSADGTARVEVLAPETLAGIAAEFSEETLSLVYDGLSLAAGPAGAEELSPAQVLPLTVEAVREGYILDQGAETLDGESCLRLTFDTTGTDGGKIAYALWFGADHLPRRAEIETGGQTAYTITFSDFSAEADTSEAAE